MANKKKKKQQSLGTASARAEKVASKRPTTAKSSSVVAKNSPFSKASQQTAKPKQQTPKPKQTAPAPKQTGPSSTSGSSQNKATVEKRIESTANQQRKNWNQAAKAYDKENGSAATRIGKASKKLSEVKGDLYDKGGTYGKATYRTLENEVYNKAKNHAGDKDYKKMLKNGNFTKEQKQEITTLHLNQIDQSASLDVDKSQTKTAFEKWKESSQNPKKKSKKKQAAVSDALGNVEGKRESVAAKAKTEKEQKTAKGKARTAFEVADADFRIAESNVSDSMEAVKNAFKKAQDDPTQENIDAFNALNAQHEQNYNAYVLAADQREKTRVDFENKMRYGKGNIDLMNLPKDDKGRTIAFDMGNYEKDYGEDTSQYQANDPTKIIALLNKKKGTTFIHKDEDGKYVLIPNYMETEDGWQRLSGEDEAWKAYQQTGKYFGKFNSEEEAAAYITELQDAQREAMGSIYGQQLTEYNDLKAEEKKAKKEMKAAQSEYESIAMSGASKEEVKAAKKKADDALKAFESASDAKDKYKAEHPDVKTDWAGLAGNTIYSGATELAYEAAGFAELAANAFDKDNDNGVSRFANYLGKKREEQSEFGSYLAADSKVAQGMNTFGPSIVAMVPMMAASIFGAAGEAMTTAEGLSRAGHIAKATQALARESAIAAGQVGKAEAVLATIGQGLWTYAHDPGFETSFVQVTGGSYADAIKNGYSEGQAMTQALVNGTLASIVEVGELGEVKMFGGVNNLNKMRKLLAEGKFSELYKTIVLSPASEALEEVTQGWIERGLENLTLGKKNPLYSTEDPNAIFNPNTAAQEAMGGALGGLVMGGGVGGVVAGYNAVQNARQSFRQSVIGQALQSTQYDVITDTLDTYDPSSKSYQMAEELMSRLENAGLTKTVTDEKGNVKAPEKLTAKEVSKLISKKELGELAEQKMLDQSKYWLGSANRGNETATTRGVSPFAQSLTENARRTNDQTSQAYRKEVDAHEMDKVLRDLVDTGGEITTDEDGNVVGGVTNEVMERELNKWQYNEPGFKNTINQYLGAEVLTDDIATTADIITALRERAAQMHEQTISLAEMAKTRAEIEASDTEEAEELAQEMAAQAKGQAVSEQVDAEAQAMANAQALDEDFASLAETEPPAGSVEAIAQQTEQRRVEQQENRQTSEENAALLEQEAERLANEGNTEAAEDLRREAERLRSLSSYTDGQERVFYDGQAYTQEELYEYLQQKHREGEFTEEEVTPEYAKLIFDLAKSQERDRALNARNSVTGASNIRVTAKGRLPNETQSIMGNIVGMLAAKRGVTAVRWVSDDVLHGSAAEYTLDGKEILLNVDRLTTQAAVEKEVGHEFFHTGSDILAALKGEKLDSEAGDALTNQVIDAFQRAAKKLYDRNPNDPVNAGIYLKYVGTFDELLAQRTTDYLIQNLLVYADDHNIKVTPSSKNGAVTLADLRQVIPGAVYNEFVDQITGEGEYNDPNRESNAYIRQEIAADWMGEIAGQQSLLERLAEDDPRLIYRLQNTARRMRVRLAGTAIDVGQFSMITSNKQFVKSLDKITESVATALRRAGEANIQAIEEKSGKATVADQMLAQARMSRPTLSTPQYQTAERRYRQMRDEYERRGNLEKVAYYDKGLEVMRATAKGLDQEYRDDWYDTPARERTIENLPDELQPGSMKDHIESWKYQYDDAMDPNYGYEAFGPANYLAIPKTPKKGGLIGMNVNESFSMPITTAMNSSGVEVTDIHSAVHKGLREAVRNAPEWVDEAFFMSNNPSKHPGLGVNKKTGKMPPMGVRFFTPHMDDDGHVIMYTVCPDVEGTANVHGISGIASNSTITVFGRPNFFGEYTAYDQVLDEEKKRIDESNYSPEQKKAFKQSLDKYYAANQLKEYLEIPEGKDKAQFTASQIGLYPQKYKRGQVQEHWKETGTFANAIRSADSLYFESKTAQKFADEMTKFWKQKWVNWVDAAQTSENRDSEWIPPPVPPIKVPTKLLRSRHLSENGVHKHTIIPEGTSQNGVDIDRRNGTYAGYTMAHDPTYNSPVKISLDELGKKSIANQVQNQRYSTPAEIQARPFMATHSQKKGERVLDTLKRDIMLSPSVAITTPKIAVASTDSESFGRYVFILKRQAVDPGEDTRNTVYGSDFYSPNRSEINQYPERYIMTEEDSDRFEEYMNDLANSFYGETDYSPWADDSALNNRWKHTKQNSAFQAASYDYAYKPSGSKRSWHDLVVASPERYAQNALRPATGLIDFGRMFFTDAYLADLGYQIDPRMPREAVDEHRARLLKRAEAEAEGNVDVPSLSEWIATQYANYISAHGRKNLDAYTSFNTEDLYPDDPISSFWNDNMEINEENDVAALYEHGEKGLYLGGNTPWEYPEFLLSMLKPQFSSIDEARSEDNYDTLKNDHGEYNRLASAATKTAREAAFQIYKEMEQIVQGKYLAPDEALRKQFNKFDGGALSVVDENFNFIAEFDPTGNNYIYEEINGLGDMSVTDPDTGQHIYDIDADGYVIKDYTDGTVPTDEEDTGDYNPYLFLDDDETSYQDFNPDDFDPEHPMHFDYDNNLNARRFLTDILKNAPITEEGISEYATSRGFSLSPSTVQAILDIKEDVQKIPVLYYESKPKRYLKPSEDVGAMVLPDNADPQIFDWLDKHDIPYETVSPMDDFEAVREKVRSFTNMRFSTPAQTGNEALDRKLSELTETQNRLERILRSDLTDNVRRTVERELSQAQAGINALRTSFAQDRAEVAANTEEGAGQIFNIPDARVTSPEDMLHSILQSATSNMTADDIIDMAYRSIGYRENSPTPRRQWKQSQVNTNTYTHAIDGFFSDVIANEEDVHARAEMLSIASRLKGEGQYLQITNKQTIEAAKRRLHDNLDAERERLERDEHVEWGAEDVCVSMGILAADLASRNPERFMKTAEMIRKKGTQAGQLIQAFKMFNRTPEGVLVEALHDLNEADVPEAKRQQLMESLQDLAQTLSSLKNNDIEGVIDVILRQAKIRNTRVSKLTLNALRNSTYEANLQRAMNQLRMIPRDYINKSTGEKISTYQVLSHLLNIKTGMRNIIANFLFNDLDSAVAHNVAFATDRFLSAISGQSSVLRPQLGGMVGGNKFKGAIRGAMEEAINVNLDIDPFDTASKYTSSKRTWSMVGGKGSQAMSTLEKMLGWELNVSDEFSKGMIYEQSMNELRPLVEAGIISQERAEAEAEYDMRYRTFQDETIVGNMLGGLHDVFNLVGVGDSGKRIRSKTVHAFGAGDLVCKYTTVPGALITRSIEFSPVGYLKVISNLYSWGKQIKALNEEINKADPSEDWVQKARDELFSAQRRAALSMGRATTGTGLILAFALMSGAGILNDEDEGGTTKEKKYETIRGLEGVSGLQLNFNALQRVIKSQDLSDAKWKEGDELVSVAFLEPFNALMSIGSLITDGDEYKSLSDMWNDLSEDKSGIFKNSLQGLWNAIADLPTMQTIGSIQQSVQYYNPETDGDNPFVYGVLEFAKSNITGFVPGPVRQFAQAQDEYYRDAYSSEGSLQQIRDTLQSTLPEVSEDLNFSRQDLPTKLTPIGTDKTSPDSDAMRVFNAIANPGTMHTYSPGELYGKLDEVYEATGDASFYPDRAAPRKLDFGEELRLTPEQRREYQTQYGKDYVEQINKAMASAKYQNATAEEKATILNDARTWAMKLTKYEMAKQFGTDYGDSDVVEKRLAKEANVAKMYLTMDDYETISVGMQNPETGNAKQDFAKPYLESRSDLSGRQKYELWHMNWDSDKNNPYTKYKNDPY